MEPTLSDMERDYPHFRKFVFAKLKEEFDRTLEPLEGESLEAIAKAEGALPLDAFIHDIETGKKA